MKWLQPSLVFTLLCSACVPSTRAAEAELKDVTINGGIQDGKARIVIDASLKGMTDGKERLLFATAIQHAMRLTRDKLEHNITATIDILQGEAKELPFTIAGDGEIKSVTGAALQDWSIRQESNNVRVLILRPRKPEKTDKPLTQLVATIVAERDLRTWSNPLKPLTLAPAQPALFNGYVKVESTGELDAQPSSATGLVPIEAKFLPESMRPDAKADVPEPLAYRFHGSAYTLPLTVTTADPELRRVVLSDFKLNGRLSDQTAAFTLTATARVKNPRGASLNLLSGGVALTELEPHPDFRVRFDNGAFVLVFDKPGDFPLRLKFNAAVRPSSGWNNLDFRVAPSPLQPVTFQGLGADTQFEFNDAARPERSGADFASFLPAGGNVKLAWKEARPEVEGKLFYSAEMLSQISIGSGLMRQLALLEFKVMQGELDRVALLLRGPGNVTRVQGANVLSWNVEPVANSADRRLVVQFNQPQKDVFGLQVQMQSELGAFPQAVDAMQLRADGATRFAGHFRVVNEGAVRLEVLQATGLSQISPEQFPESDATKALFGAQGSQRFAFRFSSADFALRAQADNVLPELSVSQLLAYHLGETELAIDAELELDIREAPVRELILRVPKGFAAARLNASGLSDYFLREPAETPDAELRLVYGQPISGRQVVQLRLERNAALGQPSWALPRIELVRAKSTRGHIAVSADAGFRLTPERTQSLTEIATAFFPRKVANIQAAFRLSEPAWEAALRVERLPQSIQADVFHLFSIGEGIAYGSSTMNYLVSGAPIATFRVVLSDEYFNVEFTGKDVRNWQKTTNGYTVQLHTPVAGAFTLLATYERPFKAQGDTLTFTGARPLDAQTEQGHTIVVSAYQFQVRPANVSPGLLALETAEVPAEYRLFFDAPILAAYRYSTRPFNLQLALSPLEQGKTLGLVVDRAALMTRISKDGEVLTDARYFVKNRGNTHFELALPSGTELWSATVNGATVVPVKNGASSLIPLPQRVDPNAIQVLDLKLASRSKTPRRVTAAAPVVTAPVLLAEWKLEPDAGQRLTFRHGSLAPTNGVSDVSGFAGLTRMFSGAGGAEDSREVRQRKEAVQVQVLAALALLALAIGAWRWAVGNGTHRMSVRHLGGALVGLAAMALAVVVLAMLRDSATRQNQVLPRGLTFLAPVQQSGSALEVSVANTSDEFSAWTAVTQGWPALLALLAWGYALLTTREWVRPVGVNLGWTLLAWVALRWPNGAPAFFVLLLAFLLVQVVLPNVRRLMQVPRKPVTPTEGSPAAAVTVLMLGGLVMSCGTMKAAELDVACIPLSVETEAKRTASPLTPALSPLRGEGVVEGVQHDSFVSGRDVADSLRTGDDYRARERSPSSREAPVATPSPLNGERAGVRGEDDIGLPRSTLLVAQATRTETQSAAARTSTATASASRTRETPLAESIAHTVRVEEKFVFASAKVHWHATKGQLLPLVFEPAVLTRVDYPVNALKLVQSFVGGKRVHQLLAQQDGSFDIEAHYQLHVTKKDGESGFALPTQHALVNRLALTLTDVDADVASPQAVSVERDTASNPGGVLRSNTLFNLVLAPVNNAWIGWKPRSRDVKREKAVFFAELFQLYVPAAGVVEGVHQVLVRPAQGELSELVFDVPGGATITDVIDPASAGQAADAKNPKAPGASSSLVSLWRFDPDTRKLRVSLNPPQSRPFILFVRSQVATGPLPFEQSVGLLSVNNAAGQLGSLGVATGSEVQLDSATADAFSPINLEDFPSSVLQPLGAQFPGLTLRRAFRYATPQGALAVKASPVEADVRVETQETLSLGEDRTVLAANLSATITRAGIFRLSFVLPGTLDVESITGQALSHWTELRAPEGRIITLHLKGKTEGQHPFAISLAGPGTKAATNYAVPRLVLREASKQWGQLVIVPEQGMRLQVTTRDGLTQLDPQKSGIRQKGVLAFRLLQSQWNLGLDIEQVDPWVQVTSLQHLTVTEALVKVAANLQYQIENTGLKALRVRVPTNAESVRFRGEQVADFLPVVGAVTNGLQTWEVKLHRRIIGKYLLQASWQTPVAENSTNTLARGVEAADVNLQRGFVTVQSGGRLQVRADAPPAALQPTEWQGIPRVLRQDIEAATANYTFRLVEPTYQLVLQLERHEATKLLPARVSAVTLTSVISDEGVMLTEARLEMVPGDKRLLHFTLPKDARFWFAFVNQNGVWPWTEQDRILIPLEQQSRTDKPMTVELFYSSRIGNSGGSALDLELLGPKFDLPLENISWRVYLNEKWRLADWKGTLQLQEEQTVRAPVSVDVQGYLQAEAAQNRDKTRQAEEYLSMGNTLLERGDPAQARRAFQSAFGLSTHDSAFNEDARVQLHNLKLQQALVGLNVRQAAAGGEAAPAPGNLKELRNRKDVAYTQQEAKQIIDGNTAEVNDNFMRLAERLIQQQDAAVTAPAAIRAAIPQQGRLLTFRRAVQVDTFADLRLNLEAKAVRAASGGVRLGTLAGIFVLLAVVAWASRRSTTSTGN